MCTKNQQQNYTKTEWRKLFNGIYFAKGLSSTAFDLSPTLVRNNIVNICKIDLTVPGLSFFTTPKSSDIYQTQNQTISQFLKTYPQVKLAVNGAYAWADSNGNATLFGLAKSCGTLVCDPTIPCPQPVLSKFANVPDSTYCGTVSLTITQTNKANFEIINKNFPGEGSPWNSIWTAVSGSPQPIESNYNWPPLPFVGGLLFNQSMVLVGGQNMAIQSINGTNGEKIAARTALGLSADKNYLFLMTIDGLENASPQYGATFYDVAEWLKIFGASDAITLDGGGSTAMAISDENNSPILINTPYGNESDPYVQRSNAHFFGVIPGN